MSEPGGAARPRRRLPDDLLYIVGVTGGTGAGKSTFVSCLAAAGPAVILDADRAGHEVLADPEIAAALARGFGADILARDGHVDRARLGPRAFASREALERLNAIVHPPLLARLRRDLDSVARSGHAGLVVLDAALLVEWDLGEWCDRVVAVTADPALQVARLVADRGLSPDEAERRIALQLPEAARVGYADDVLVNRGDRKEFDVAAGRLAREIHDAARAALPARRSGASDR